MKQVQIVKPTRTTRDTNVDLRTPSGRELRF
jgi:hypothetical protein